MDNLMKTLVYMSFISTLFSNPLFSFAQDAASAGEHSAVAFIGSYTKKEGHVDGKGEGIYSVYQDQETGALKFGTTLAEITNPSFVKTSPDGNYLYAVSELGPGDAASGFIHTYRIAPDNSLEEINKVPSIGFAPCHIEVDASGKYIFVSNYSGGVVVMFEKNEDGGLREKEVLYMENKEGSHPHSVTLNPANTKAYIADLGNDKIWIYDFDASSGNLKAQAPVSLPKGAGPRHFLFSGDGQFAYSINELNSSVSVFKVLEDGGLENQQHISSLPVDFEGDNSAADLHLHPSGKILYASNRGHNSIAVFRRDSATGNLENIGFQETMGKTPRNFAVSSEGDFLYVANQDSDTLTSFRIDPSTGKLEPHLEPLEISSPVCIEFR